jgi:ribosomal protein L7Ae-like RNA K-turn-binding protein
MKFSNINLSLAKGLHEVTKALSCDEKPLFVVLAEDCDEARIK